MAAEAGDGFARMVSLACHDLRTPLATINGFAKTMIRGGALPEREARFTGLIDEAAAQMAALLDQLALAARIDADRYEPLLEAADTLELASSASDERISASGTGATVETDPAVVRAALEAFALAALRHGELDGVGWSVSGRALRLGPLPAAAVPVVDASSPRDLGAIVARMAVEALGGSVAAEGEELRVTL
jgi:signal transduction histidine kinase